MEKKYILELIETIQERIIFDCNNDKLKVSEYKQLVDNIYNKLNRSVL
tara:strand:+ start:518 stop:661 length:144 start_codon:yes stop_codon:yes gene_type:complete